MKITIEIDNPGVALLHVARAGALMRAKEANMANCRSCDKDLMARYGQGATFFEALRDKLREKINESSGS